jgi:H+-translocating NAD(P) transhydrogenase subunit alpha
VELQLHVLGVVVFVMAAFVGHHVVHRVPPLLHTPLMSATNAISAISVVAAIAVAGTKFETVRTILGVLAVAAATCNVVGGFVITDRMLRMFRGDQPRKDAPKGARS